jgi:hypothetical protein
MIRSTTGQRISLPVVNRRLNFLEAKVIIDAHKNSKSLENTVYLDTFWIRSDHLASSTFIRRFVGCTELSYTQINNRLRIMIGSLVGTEFYLAPKHCLCHNR